jgi:hypothetical protein
MQVTLGFSILGADFYCTADVRVTNRSHAGEVGFNGLYGPDAPCDCEWQLKSVTLQEDMPGKLGPSLEVPAWLEKLISEGDKLNDAVQEAEREEPRGRRAMKQAME